MKSNLKLFLFSVFLILSSTSFVFADFKFLEELQKAQEAQQAAPQLPVEVMTHIQTAQELMAQAQQILSTNGSDKNVIKTAMGLYTSAGEHFEKVLKQFETMGPGAVSENDLNGVKGAIDSCAAAVLRLKGQLSS